MAESLDAAPRIITDPVKSARAVGLRYVSDGEPGIRRIRIGSGFGYVGRRRNRIRDPEVLGRIRSLAIPPAWEDVWICPLAEGHIQATGRDQRGRKQYRYHPRWREVRDESKYGRPRLLLEAMKRRTEDALSTSLEELRPEEAAVAGILQQRLARALSAGSAPRGRRGRERPGERRRQRSRDRARARTAV